MRRTAAVTSTLVVSYTKRSHFGGRALCPPRIPAAYRRTVFHSSRGVDGVVSLRGVAAAHSRARRKTI